MMSSNRLFRWMVVSALVVVGADADAGAGPPASPRGGRGFCPEGTRQNGSDCMEDHERYCERPDGRWHGPYEAVHDQVVTVEGRFRDDLPDGRWVYRAHDRRVLGTSVFTKGSGTFRAFHPDGSRLAEVELQGGRVRSLRAYSEKGELLLAGAYTFEKALTAPEAVPPRLPAGAPDGGPEAAAARRARLADQVARMGMAAGDPRPGRARIVISSLSGCLAAKTLSGPIEQFGVPDGEWLEVRRRVIYNRGVRVRVEPRPATPGPSPPPR